MDFLLEWQLSEKTFWWVKPAFFFDYRFQIIINFYAFCQNMSKNDTIFQMSIPLIS